MMMLDAHPEIYVSRESWFLIDLMDALPLHGFLRPDQVDKAFDIIRKHPRWQRWGITDTILAECLQSLSNPDLATLVEAVFRLDLGDDDKSRWGDKTPGYVTEVERIHSLFPNAQFIHIIRDARDVCISLRKVGWHGPTVVHMARYWREQVAIGMATGRRLGNSNYLEVSYEALVTDVESTLRNICLFLAVPFDTKMLVWHKQTAEKTADSPMKFQTKLDRAPRPSDVGRWRNELSRLSVVVVEAYAGDVMIQAGQARHFGRDLSFFRPLFNSYALTCSALVRVLRLLRRPRLAAR